MEPVRCGLRIVDVFDVTFSGFGGEPIKAWLHRPAGQAGDLPVVVRYCGYEGGRGLPHQVNSWPLAGYASFSIDARGQGSGSGWSGDTPDSGPFGQSTLGLLTHGILEPETYYYRRLFTDAVLAVDAVHQLKGNRRQRGRRHRDQPGWRHYSRRRWFITRYICGHARRALPQRHRQRDGTE